MKALF